MHVGTERTHLNLRQAQGAVSAAGDSPHFRASERAKLLDSTVTKTAQVGVIVHASIVPGFRLEGTC